MKNKELFFITILISTALKSLPVFAADPATSEGISNPVLTKFVGPGALSLLIATLWKTAFLVGGIITLAFLVLGGVTWITGAGDKTSTEKARSMITDAVIGLVIIAASYAIIKFIGGVLGVDILNPSFP